MPFYDYDPNEVSEAATEYAVVQQRMNILRRRALLDPRDPDALDEDEIAELEALKEWEP